MDLKEEVPGSWRMPNIGAVKDTSEAQWLVEGLDRTLETVGSLVPRGFEAYARILHPAWRVPREGGRLVRSPVRWSEVGELRGTRDPGDPPPAGPFAVIPDSPGRGASRCRKLR